MAYHNPFDQKSLRTRADEILGHFGISQFAISEVVQEYFTEWRTYHNATHLMNMLEVLHQLTLDAEFKMRVGLLVLYHDVFYKVGRPISFNERRSLEWAVDHIERTDNPEKIRLASLLEQGILATINHTLDGVDKCFEKEVALLIDLDLWGLGDEQHRFNENTDRIWHEQRYAYTWGEFQSSQRAWANDLRNRPSVYYTKYAAHREEQARKNLRYLILQSKY